MGLCHLFYFLVYRGKLVCATPPTPLDICVFIPTHSDQHDMKMTVKTEFWDAASFTWVMGLWQFISKFIIINIPSGDVCLCENIYSESFTWLHNHSSWQKAVYGRHPCPTFLVIKVLHRLYYSIASYALKTLILKLLFVSCELDRLILLFMHVPVVSEQWHFPEICC